jgi:ABC-type lipoprotein release transport system permease subunit
MFSLVIRTILHYRHVLLPVIAGVSVAGAVIIGALIVGDSVRGSLRHIAMDRIGAIDHVLLAPRWFSPSIVDRTDTAVELHEVVFVQQVTAKQELRVDDKQVVHRANEMSLFGVEDTFWQLGSIRPQKLPVGEQVVLNQSLATVLHAKVGDKINLYIPAQSVVPADSALGKRDIDTFALPRWEVIDVLPDESLARFSLRSDQRPAWNAFVDRSTLQSEIKIGEKVNAIFAKGQSGSLLQKLKPSLADLGLEVKHVAKRFPADGPTILDYSIVTTDQMMLQDAIVKPMLDSTKELNPSPILTYLANGIEREANNRASPVSNRSSVPYSTISAVRWKTLSGMLNNAPVHQAIATEPTQKDWCVVNQWLANELQIQVGDQLKIDYFLPETVEGTNVEKSFSVKVVAIAPWTIPTKPNAFEVSPSPFNDPNWTPTVPGITDKDSIDDWDTPFPLKRKIEKQDDDYWSLQGLTPKLFIDYDFGVSLFGSRFGNVTGIRYENADASGRERVASELLDVVKSDWGSIGWRDIPLRVQQLQRSSGTTPFDALFLSLSFFLIAAGLLLVVLLFRLSIEKRADHWGLLVATGWTRKSVRRLLLMEGAVLAAIGASVGIVLGIGYAYTMIALLKTWWVGAISVSFLDYYLRPLSLVMGWGLTWIAAIGAILVATRKLNHSPIASLLKGRIEELQFHQRPSSWLRWVGVVCAVAGVGTLAMGSGLQGQAQAGAFVGGGMLFMMFGLSYVWQKLKTGKSSWSAIPSGVDLARSNAKRSPTRSILAIALVSIASFLILSMSLFQATPTEPGLGGFQFLGKSSSPIHSEIGNPVVRKEALGARSEEIGDIEIVSMRMRGGDDASCNNLYQASEPQILGVSSRISSIDIDEKGKSRFAWFQTAKSSDSPWQSLEESATGEAGAPLPVVIDQNTALWALHLGGYVGERFAYEFDGKKIHFRTVGVLQNTILQGSLLIGESNFEQVFPAITGYRSFLVQVPASLRAKSDEIKAALEDGWEEPGLSLVRSDSVLSQLLAVQNTYLSAFQLLGALGLLLGTIGLGVAQLRGAMERSSELAAMRAIGFTKGRLTWLLSLENGWQLMRGMLIGTMAAALATIPALMSGQPFGGIVNPLLMLLLIVVLGALTSWLSAWLAMRAPLLQSLRAK